MTIVILAAGIGSRYGGLKQLEAVGPHGATIMDYSVFDARRAGCDTVVFVIRPQMQEAFDASIGSRYRGHLRVEYAHQHLEALPAGFAVPAGRTKPWGTGQALLVAEPLVHGPFIAANADDFYGPTAFAALGDFLRQAPTATPPTFALVGYTPRRLAGEHNGDAWTPTRRPRRPLCRCPGPRPPPHRRRARLDEPMGLPSADVRAPA